MELLQTIVNQKAFNKVSTRIKKNAINDLGYFNLFECGKKLLNNLDATCER